MPECLTDFKVLDAKRRTVFWEQDVHGAVHNCTDSVDPNKSMRMTKKVHRSESESYKYMSLLY